MKIVKYDKAKTVQASSGGSSGGGSGSSTTIQGGSASLDRTIWGKNDTGEDIDGTMIVNGDVNIKVISYNWDDTGDDDETGEDEDYEEGGGNLNVELKTTTKDLEVSNDAYIQKHLYINHSHSDHDKEKVCLIDEVEKNTKRIGSLETSVEALDTNLQMAETAIKNNADEIEKLKQKSTASDTTDSELKDEIDKIKEQMADGSAIENLLKQIEILKYGDYNNPVILYSGMLFKYSTSNSYYNSGSIKDCLQLSIKEVNEGVITLELTPSASSEKEMFIYVKSINATQEESHDTEARDNYYKGRSNGAHWFECWVSESAKNKATIKVREFHQGNGDNDTWYSSSWVEDGSVRGVNLTISGYISFSS